MVNGFYMNMSKTQFPGKRNIIIGSISRIVLQILVSVGFYFSLMFIHRLVGEVFRDDTGVARASSLLVSKSEPFISKLSISNLLEFLPKFITSSDPLNWG